MLIDITCRQPTVYFMGRVKMYCDLGRDSLNIRLSYLISAMATEDGLLEGGPISPIGKQG